MPKLGTWVKRVLLALCCVFLAGLTVLGIGASIERWYQRPWTLMLQLPEVPAVQYADAEIDGYIFSLWQQCEEKRTSVMKDAMRQGQTPMPLACRRL
jgi:hypothetical protein